jgi:hypothetical protein
MKKVVIALLALASFSALAQNLNEKSYLIKNPTHSNSEIPFAYYSDENGVCKALGYGRAAKGSSRYGEIALNVKVNSAGSVVASGIDYILQQIVCLNKTNVEISESVVLVTEPRHADSNLLFQYYADQNGVCRNLGYLRGAVGSATYTDKTDTISVNSDGEVIGGPYDYGMGSILCVAEGSSYNY